MDRNFHKGAARHGTGASPPSDAWLFAQALLGKPIPNTSRAEADARAKREHLEWLAQISPRRAEQFRKLQCPETEARHQRALLEWLAQISPEHEAKLRRLLREEAEAEEAHDRRERFNEAYSATIAEWNEDDHSRRGYGPHPGAWVNKGNAVGVVQGVYDATQNGVNISNGAQVAGGLLGLSANATAVRDLSRASAARRLAEVDEFVAKLPRKTTPTKAAANQYEIKHAGPYNYTVSGGGESFTIDGYRGSTILEAKHIDKPTKSPYVPGSSCPAPVRRKILDDTREQLRKVRTIIESGSTPFKSVEIVTNSPEAKRLFEGLLKEARVPGTVRLQP